MSTVETHTPLGYRASVLQPARRIIPHIELRRPPMLVPATLTWAGDRVGTARLDTGGTLDVRLPDVLWLKAGDRVKLYHYPDGWVAVLRYRFTDIPGPEEVDR